MSHSSSEVNDVWVYHEVSYCDAPHPAVNRVILQIIFASTYISDLEATTADTHSYNKK